MKLFRYAVINSEGLYASELLYQDWYEDINLFCGAPWVEETKAYLFYDLDFAKKFAADFNAKIQYVEIKFLEDVYDAD